MVRSGASKHVEAFTQFKGTLAIYIKSVGAPEYQLYKHSYTPYGSMKRSKPRPPLAGDNDENLINSINFKGIRKHGWFLRTYQW